MTIPPTDSGYVSRLRHGYRIGPDAAVRRYRDLRTTTWGRAIIDRARIVLGLIGIMWAIELIDTVALGRSLNAIGIHPRDVGRAWQIPLAPFLHGDFGHLVSNTGPLLWLGAMVSVWGVGEFVLVTAGITALGGTGTWLIGRAAIHQGGSLLALGFFGYLIARGVVERRAIAVVLAILTVYWYGYAAWSILPGVPRISWESHLSGMLAGGAIGYVRARASRAVL
jgi:membrane associated rhomboid family serine protease